MGALIVSLSIRWRGREGGYNCILSGCRCFVCKRAYRDVFLGVKQCFISLSKMDFYTYFVYLPWIRKRGPSFMDIDTIYIYFLIK